MAPEATIAGMDHDAETAPCRVCGNRAAFEFAVRGQKLFRCGGCGYLEVAPVPSQAALDEIYGRQYFEKTKYRNDDAQELEQDRRAKLLLKAGIRPGSKVLDFGCATGEFIARIKKGHEAYGCDVSPDAIARSKALHPELETRLFVLTPGKSFPNNLPKMDAIVAWDVIEHLGDPLAVVQLLSAQLRPGGILAISTPDAGALIARLMGSRWAFMTPPEHLGFFNVAIMDRLFAREGMTRVLAMSRGKWANVAFLAYKLRRVFPELLPESWIHRFGQSRFSRWCIYVPTRDVLYVVGQKSTGI
ncbi:class I SAM-dependent methyltransferase [Bradyrhizobium sp. AUGA SZCCT0240]|uniref:class I SAM-dependent methyltransferase n=1 Tax=Bradyrhizobium sp. AUGA SZCCT0240 TaxID=2807669 RepID=UPI001BA45FFC|nr:class I SAM-dependent methyltransferase [Bradyrhizobium sp. AUGA SZCCT0240]MBR1257955.1 class I SAM-dependent methyltransferase [Bradyrhizobium sp. AUGA SZCCT0240]